MILKTRLTTSAKRLRISTLVSDARLLANAYPHDGKASEAIAALNRIRAFAVMDPLYYQALYEVQIYLGNTKEAVKAAQRWQVLRPDSTDTAPKAWRWSNSLTATPTPRRAAAKEAIDAGSVSSTVFAIYGET